MTSQSDKVMVLTKRGKMKEAILVLEKTYIDPYVIANSTPEEDFSRESRKTEDSLSIKNIGDRFLNAIQTLSAPPEKQGPTNTSSINLQNVNNPSETSSAIKNAYIIYSFLSQ